VALAAKFNISPGRWKHFWPVVIVLTERSGKMNRMRFAHQNYVEKSLHASQRLIAHFESLFSLKKSVLEAVKVPWSHFEAAPASDDLVKVTTT
jgi:hypothetical protein